jgi:hypothetical protein
MTAIMAIIFPYSYMVDAADQDKFDASKNELHNLLDKPQLSGIPVRTSITTDIWYFVSYRC